MQGLKEKRARDPSEIDTLSTGCEGTTWGVLKIPEKRAPPVKKKENTRQ